MFDNNEYDPGYARERLSEMIDHGADIRTPRKKALDRYNHDRTDWMINLFNSDDAGAMPKLEDYEAEEMKKAEAGQDAADMAGGGADGLINSPGLRLRAAMTEGVASVPMSRQKAPAGPGGGFRNQPPVRKPLQGPGGGMLDWANSPVSQNTEWEKYGVSYLPKGNNMFVSSLESRARWSPERGEFYVAGEENTPPPLSQNRAVHEYLRKEYPWGSDMTYSDAAVKNMQNVAPVIKDASRETGVFKEAIAAAMCDEYTSRFERFGGRLGDRLDNVQDKASRMRPFKVSLSEIEKYMTENPEGAHERSFKNSKTWDIGPYNINMSTGYRIFKENVLDADSDNPIRQYVMTGLQPDATDDEKWSNFRDRCMLEPSGAVYTVAAVLKEGQEKLAPYMEGLSREEQAALLVTYYKQGWDNMLARYGERMAQNPPPGGETPPMRPGTGARMFFNMRTIQNALE